MSALNGWVSRDHVHFAVDGCTYDATGKIENVGDKSAVLPAINMALAARGPIMILPQIVHGVSANFCTFDSAVEHIGEMTRELLARGRNILARIGFGKYELLIGGISETRGPELHIVNSYGPEAFRLLPVSAYVSPCDDVLLEQLRGMGAHPEHLADADPNALALAIIEAQRERSWPGPRGDIQAVGGFVNLITIGRDAIATRILKRWPDKIGSHICDTGPSAIKVMRAAEPHDLIR